MKLEEKASFVVSKIILEQDGKFLAKDILDQVEKKIKHQFDSRENLEKYILNKLNSMCEYGLIGRTTVYYFSL